MSNTLEKLEHNMVKISMEIPTEDFDKACDRAYQKEKNRITLPGFRKGKAPRKMIERFYGKEIFFEDALNDIFAGCIYECGEGAGVGCCEPSPDRCG